MPQESGQTALFCYGHCMMQSDVTRMASLLPIFPEETRVHGWLRKTQNASLAPSPLRVYTPLQAEENLLLWRDLELSLSGIYTYLSKSFKN